MSKNNSIVSEAFTSHNGKKLSAMSAVADPGFSPGGGAPTPKSAIIFQFFAENCMKMKEFGPPGGGASLAPPLGSANGVDQHFPLTIPITMKLMEQFMASVGNERIAFVCVGGGCFGREGQSSPV